MLLNSHYIAQHGYMDEGYFLYHEEPDLALRLDKPFRVRIVLDAIVFHKQGVTTGSAALAERNLASDYYLLRGRILWAKKMGFIVFFLAILSAFPQVARRLFVSRRHFRNSVVAITDGIFNVRGPRR